MTKSLSKKLVILAISIVLLIIAIFTTSKGAFRPVTIFKQNVQIGKLNLSRTEWLQGYATLKSKLNDPIYLNLDNKSRGVTLSEMGFGINRDKLSKLTKTCRTKTFKIFCTNTSNEQIDPNEIITTNNDVLAGFLEELDAELAYLGDSNIVSFVENEFRAVTYDTGISVDRNVFLDKAQIADFLTQDKVQIKLTTNTEASKDSINMATTNLIENMSYSLLIKYGRNPVYIPSDIMKDFIDTKVKDDLIYGTVNEEKIAEYLMELDETYANEDIIVIKEGAIDAIKRAILFRAVNYEINNAVILPLEGSSKTSGEMHDEYIEIIKSQQRAYRFEGGELVKTYIISTGLTWETPTGEFQVLGKQKMTISYFGNWYMPDYLPIGTVYGYRFGFHAIPYHLDSAGNVYSRDINTMGSPATGGCIQMTNPDALELFNWAKVGTPVYIYD